MPRSPIIVPRSGLILPRQRVVPVGLRGFGSLMSDGVDDYVEGTNPISGSQQCTLVSWVKCRRRAGTTQVVMQLGNSATGEAQMLCVTPSDTWGGGIYGVMSISSGVVVDDSWHRVVYVYPGPGEPSFVAVDGEVRATFAPSAASVAGTAARLFLRCGSVGYPFAGSTWDSRAYSRAWTPQEVAADYAGEWVDPTGLARWWTGENPGYGSTCREEIGGTDDAITGALWKPDVPRKPRRIVEDVRAAPFLMGGSSVLMVPNSIAIRPEAQSCGWMCWVWRDKYVSTAHNQLLMTTGGMVAPFYVHGAGPFTAYFQDGSVGVAVTGPFGRSEHGWIHFATVIDRSSGYVSMYINASLVGRSSIGALGSVSPTSDMSLGNGAAYTRTAFNDLIWRKGAPFTRDEIAAYYYDGIVPSTPSGCIQIHWPLDEGSGTTVRSIPAGYEGTLTSASWTTRTRSKARSAA